MTQESGRGSKSLRGLKASSIFENEAYCKTRKLEVPVNETMRVPRKSKKNPAYRTNAQLYPSDELHPLLVLAIIFFISIWRIIKRIINP